MQWKKNRKKKVEAIFSCGKHRNFAQVCFSWNTAHVFPINERVRIWRGDAHSGFVLLASLFITTNYPLRSFIATSCLISVHLHTFKCWKLSSTLQGVFCSRALRQSLSVLERHFPRLVSQAKSGLVCVW